MNSNRKSKRHPDIPAMHPGESLREDIFPAIKRTGKQIAADLNIPPDELEAVLQEQAPVTAELALKLARYVGGSPEQWLRLQEAYDLWLARQKLDVSHIEPAERIEAAE